MKGLHSLRCQTFQQSPVTTEMIHDEQGRKAILPCAVVGNGQKGRLTHMLATSAPGGGMSGHMLSPTAGQRASSSRRDSGSVSYCPAQ